MEFSASVYDQSSARYAVGFAGFRPGFFAFEVLGFGSGVWGVARINQYIAFRTLGRLNQGMLGRWL